MNEDARVAGFRSRGTLAWALSGVVVLSSVIQIGGTWSGIESLQTLPSLFGSVTAEGTGIEVVMGVAVLLTVGWLGQGVARLSQKTNRSTPALGLFTGGLIVVVGVWNGSAALGIGGVAPIVEGIVTVGIGVFGTAGLAVPGRRTATRSASRDGSRDPGTHQQKTARRRASIDDRTLDRLEPIVPEAVARARDRSASANPEPEPIEPMIRRRVKDAIEAGKLFPAITSRYGGRYELVNLPTRFREVELPPTGDPVHIRTLQSATLDRVTADETTLAEIGSIIETIDAHHEEIQAYIGEREVEFDERLDHLDDTIESVETLADRLQGSFGQRTREYVCEGRHPTVEGVPQIRSRIDEAKTSLHNCAFEEALQTLQTGEEKAESLLTAVDFLVGLSGTAASRSTGATVPNRTTAVLLEELRPAMEETFQRTVSIEGDRIALGSDRTETSGDAAETDENTVSHRDEHSKAPKNEPHQDVRRVDPATKADEIVFALREIGGTVDGTDQRVEFQTAELPEGVASSTVLVELAAFCRRQADIVDSVELQEGAPPGFLTIEFTDKPTNDAVETLRHRFVEQHRTG